MKSTVVLIFLLFNECIFSFAQTLTWKCNVRCNDFYGLMHQVTKHNCNSKKIVKHREKRRRTFVSDEICNQIMQSDTIEVIYHPDYVDFIVGCFREYVLTDSITYLLTIPGEPAIYVEDPYYSEMIRKIRDNQFVIGKSDFTQIHGGSDIFYYYKFVRQHDNYFDYYYETFSFSPFSSLLYKLPDPE